MEEKTVAWQLTGGAPHGGGVMTALLGMIGAKRKTTAKARTIATRLRLIRRMIG